MQKKSKSVCCLIVEYMLINYKNIEDFYHVLVNQNKSIFQKKVSQKFITNFLIHHFYVFRIKVYVEYNNRFHLHILSNNRIYY